MTASSCFFLAISSLASFIFCRSSSVKYLSTFIDPQEVQWFFLIKKYRIIKAGMPT